MTIDEARRSIHRLVIYTPPGNWDGPQEEGEITGTSETSVFVRYRGNLHSKGTRPEDLQFSYGGAA